MKRAARYTLFGVIHQDRLIISDHEDGVQPRVTRHGRRLTKVGTSLPEQEVVGSHQVLAGAPCRGDTRMFGPSEMLERLIELLTVFRSDPLLKVQGDHDVGWVHVRRKP